MWLANIRHAFLLTGMRRLPEQGACYFTVFFSRFVAQSNVKVVILPFSESVIETGPPVEHESAAVMSAQAAIAVAMYAGIPADRFMMASISFKLSFPFMSGSPCDG